MRRREGCEKRYVKNAQMVGEQQLFGGTSSKATGWQEVVDKTSLSPS